MSAKKNNSSQKKNLRCQTLFKSLISLKSSIGSVTIGKMNDQISQHNEKPSSHFPKHIALISEILIFLFFINTFLLQSYVIPSGSMQNNLLIGDHLLVDKITYSQSFGLFDSLLLPQREIKRGSMVTFKAPLEPEKEYVKRIIGLPGERIQIVDNTVFINGRPLKEDYVTFKENQIGQFHGENMAETVIPAHHYFCMGDNRWNSSDSRFWGPVHRNLIVGKPWLIYWSFEAPKEEYLEAGFLAKIKSIGYTALLFFSKTRWNRTIMLLH